MEKAASMFFFTTSLFLRNHFSRDAVEKQRHGKSTVAKKAMSWKKRHCGKKQCCAKSDLMEKTMLWKKQCRGKGDVEKSDVGENQR